MDRREFLKFTASGMIAGSVLRARADAAEAYEDREELARHRITEIEHRSISLNYPRLVGKNAQLDVHGRGPSPAVLIVRTDRGATGWGEAWGPGDAWDEARDLAVGKRLDELFHPAVGLLDMRLRPIDFALHDLAGRILEKPVYAMLGEHGERENTCYSGMIYFDDLEPPDAPAGVDRVIENCRHDYELGHRQFKVKIGRGHRWMEPDEGLARDIEVTRAIREAFPDVDILVDGNNGFEPARFNRFLDGVEDIELFWIEEPFEERHAGLRTLRKWLTEHDWRTYVADGEAGFPKKRLLALHAEGLVDVFLPDINGYGFTPWRSMMRELQQLGILASPHTWGSILKTCYTAHLATGLGNVLTIEGVPSTSEDVDLSGYELDDGLLRTPSSPGFGIELIG